MKKFLFSICVFAYLVFVTVTIKVNPKIFPVKAIIKAIGKLPKNMTVTLLLIGIMAIVSIIIYISAKKAGGKNGK